MAEESENEPLNIIKFRIDEILGTKTVLTKQKKTHQDKRRENFISMIALLQASLNRQTVLQQEFGIDFSNYEEMYFEIIDRFISYAFTPNQQRLVSFYLYDRLNADGSMNMLILPDNSELILQSPEDLYEVINLYK